MLAQGKKLRIPIVLGLLVGLLAVSCSDDDPVAPPPPVTSVTATIGPAGGSLKSADGSLTLTIPQGALTGNSEITIRNVSPASLGPEFPGQSAVEIRSQEALAKRAGLAMNFVAPVNPAPPAPGVQQVAISFPLGFIATQVGTLAAVVDSFEFFFDSATGAVQAFGSLDMSGGPTQPPAEGVSNIVAVGFWPGLTVEIAGIPLLPLGGLQNSFNLTTTITATADNILETRSRSGGRSRRHTSFIMARGVSCLTFYGEYLAMDFNAAPGKLCSLMVSDHC